MNQQQPPAADVDPSKAPAALARASRELKVEDALLYLDQVKMEFSDKPYIYNEFLDIMKNFKAQSIGTPGVIERVKNLFKGYNKLILGFNTFLPEGEGYKIELTPEELASDTKKVVPAVKTETSSSVMPTQKQIDNTFTNHAARMNQPGQTTNTEPLAGQPQQMQQAHAIHYVTKIRNRFSDQPDTYRQFLKILHTYQKEQKGIKEVLEQVSTLFADHSDLLMEFTYFLPDAVQEQAKERLHRAARESEARRHAKMTALRAAPGAKKVHAPVVTSLAREPMTIGTIFRSQNPMAFGPGANRDGMLINNSLKPVQSGWANTGGESSSNLQGQDTALSAANAKKRARADAKGPGPAGAVKGDPRGGKKQLVHGLNDLESESQDGDLGRKQSETSASGKKMPRGGARGVKGSSEGGSNMASTDVRNTQERAMSAYHNSSRGNGRDSHISMSAERRFFDTVKEVLVGTSRDSWVEFVKLLELFSADTISKAELLETAGDLFVQASGNGVAGNELTLEFKRLLANRSDYEAHKEDVWFAVPLSEIDFSQCRKCTPSYRALPKDYPKPKCTERSEEESAVLNDQWVSIPIGSEESYSFKHMRKNQYEESLFKVEDERFEIDMIIDSNMNTIRVLEPLAEEIAQLRGLETRGAHTAQEEGGAEGGNGTIKSPSSSSSHINLSPRFTFQLDKRHLSTVNLNAISRIYGEAHGEEILELLRKNPVAAIPVILKRLRQKDVEWRAARVELNNGWKETVARNHFKSFDHRSFYFRQSDKKYLSTRHLVSEIVGVPVVGTVPAPVASSGVFGAAPLSSASAASEGENNSTVTTAAVSVELTNVGSAVPFSITTAAALSVATENGLGRSHEDNQIAGMGLRVEEENASLLVGMAPQLLLNYSNASHIVHRDIYKIMCHSAENTLNNSSDKERLAALWRDLLRVFFNVPPHYLYSQLVPSLGSSASSSSTVVGESLVVPVIVLDPSEAWLPSTRVLTLFGSGTIKAFRAADSMYEVALSFGTAFLNPNVIYGAEQLSKQALSAIGVTTDPDTGKDRIFNGLVHSEPVAASTSTSTKGKSTTTPEAVPTTVHDPCKLFFGTQMCYIFLRLHHTLYIRLSIAHQLASEASAHYREQVREGGPINQSPRFAASHNHTSLLSFMDAEDTEAHVVHHHGAHGAGLSAADRCNPVYDTFFGHLLGLIEGNIDNARFEDLCRDLLGNKAYVLYTLDKIIAQGIKHLQAMASDENVNKLVGLFVYHHHKGSSQQGQGNAGVDPTLYRNHVSHILSHTMEDVYRFQLMTPHAGISTGTSQVGIQHMGILNPNHLPSLGAVGVTFLPEGVSVAINNNLDDEEEDEEEEEAMDVSLGGPGLSPPILQRQMSNMSAKSSLLSPNGRSMSMSRDDGELKAPKAVLSDGEDSGSESDREDEEEEDEEEEGQAQLEGDDHQSDGNNGDDDQDGPPSPPKQLLYSPRASRQQFMSTSS